jgi:two-component system response regulator MtrA
MSPEKLPVVLVAEDDDEMRELITHRLTADGMKVIEIEDGFELRDYLTLCQPGGELPEPDAVVTDINMPGEAGPETLSHFEFLQAPVVLISACGGALLRSWATRLNAAAALEKPLNLDDLSAMITGIMIARERH